MVRSTHRGMQGAQGVLVNFAALISIYEERPALRGGSRRVSLLMCGSQVCRTFTIPERGDIVSFLSTVRWCATAGCVAPVLCPVFI